ncbi:kinesin-like calmodulin-binding protein [Striga asiatica]|uniref:Kinesin-like calmodulin-binding protein n=1 Tax=Striga asiatica TaxID=4170 RepID=A0A5A7QPA1_STRAF|nr:kinesin-like calmodulin-binding protein [Striga asiatica]
MAQDMVTVARPPCTFLTAKASWLDNRPHLHPATLHQPSSPPTIVRSSCGQHRLARNRPSPATALEPPLASRWRLERISGEKTNGDLSTPTSDLQRQRASISPLSSGLGPSAGKSTRPQRRDFRESSTSPAGSRRLRSCNRERENAGEELQFLTAEETKRGCRRLTLRDESSSPASGREQTNSSRDARAYSSGFRAPPDEQRGQLRADGAWSGAAAGRAISESAREQPGGKRASFSALFRVPKERVRRWRRRQRVRCVQECTESPENNSLKQVVGDGVTGGGCGLWQIWSECWQRRDLRDCCGGGLVADVGGCRRK